MQPIAAADVAAILADVVTSVCSFSSPSPLTGRDQGRGDRRDSESRSEREVVAPQHGPISQSPNPPRQPPVPSPQPLPLNTTIEIAGPDPIRMDDLIRQYLTATSRSTPHTTLRSPLPAPRSVITDPTATYFGIPVNDQSLVPTGPAPRPNPFCRLADQT